MNTILTQTQSQEPMKCTMLISMVQRVFLELRKAVDFNNSFHDVSHLKVVPNTRSASSSYPTLRSTGTPLDPFLTEIDGEV